MDTTASNCYELGHLSDADLLAGTRGLVARSNHHLAALLAHLAEVGARAFTGHRACASLYAYCQYDLRMSEDSAYQHVRAVKIVQQFPALFEHIAARLLEEPTSGILSQVRGEV